MEILSGILVFSLAWWLWLFVLLPFGVRAVETPDVGHSIGAPEKTLLGRKIAGATLLATITTALYLWFMAQHGNSFREWFEYNPDAASVSITTPALEKSE